MKLLKTFLLILLPFFSLTSFARAGEQIYISNGPSGYLAVPPEEIQLTTSYPAILLIHDWWGLTEQIKVIADNLADQGFVTFAIDLYHGKQTTDEADAHLFSSSLPAELTLTDMRTSLLYLRNLTYVNADRIGVLGVGMGAKWGLKLTARSTDQIRALSTFFLDVSDDFGDLSKLSAPLHGIFAEDDPVNTVGEIDEFDFNLIQMNKRPDIYVYPHMKKGFTFASHPNYSQLASQDAWKKTLIFLKRNLAYA